MNLARTSDGTTPPTVWRVHVPYIWLRAVERGTKSELRLPLTAANSMVNPGAFDRLSLETGRRHQAARSLLRARCDFPNGKPRAVAVTPRYSVGDLMWFSVPRTASQARAGSRRTLELSQVTVARVQDMTEEDAMREGILATPSREAFARIWDDWHGAGTWQANPWVWVVRFAVLRENVDVLLRRMAS